MIDIIDDYLDKELFGRIQKFVLGDQNIPWYLQNDISGNGDDSMAYFTHVFYGNHSIRSDHFGFVIEPITFMMGSKALIRVKGNLYPRTDNLVYHKPHTDYEYSHKAAIFYLNTNNGYTIIGDKKIESVENRLLRFDASVEHSSTNCTDVPYRANINFNYFA